MLLSALFGGVAYALWFFAAPAGFYVVGGVVYYDVSPLMLTALTVVSYAAVSVWDRLTRKERARPDMNTACSSKGTRQRRCAGTV